MLEIPDAVDLDLPPMDLSGWTDPSDDLQQSNFNDSAFVVANGHAQTSSEDEPIAKVAAAGQFTSHSWVHLPLTTFSSLLTLLNCDHGYADQSGNTTLTKTENSAKTIPSKQAPRHPPVLLPKSPNPLLQKHRSSVAKAATMSTVPNQLHQRRARHETEVHHLTKH